MADTNFFADELTYPRPRQRKRFSLEQASRTIPLVSRIVADICRTHAQAASLHARLESRMERSQRNVLEADLERAVEKMHNYVDELAEIGARMADYRRGQVDFLSRSAGRDVLLCWKMGDTYISGWYEPDDPVDAVKPLAALAPHA